MSADGGRARRAHDQYEGTASNRPGTPSRRSGALTGYRFDGAWYLCGYAIELALKARICRTLFSGVEDRVRANRMAEWSVVLDWNPEKRYQANRLSTAQQAAHMVKCVE